MTTIFSKEDAKVICSIPISRIGAADKQIWAPSKNGKFSKKNAYYVVQQRKKVGEGRPSTEGEEAEEWKKLRSLEIPGAAKHFLWRAINNILPSKENLLKRKITRDPKCPICQMEDEFVIHALWSCPTISDV